MAGFGPVGSFPVASIPGSSSGGTNYTPGTGAIVFEGLAPASIFSFAPTQVYSEFAEVLHGGDAGYIRAYSLFAGVLHGGDPGNIRAYGLYVEVLRSVALAPVGGGSICILW